MIKIKIAVKFFSLIYNVNCCREQVKIPRNKPFIFLKGEGNENTFITWHAHGAAINATAAFTSEADHTLAKDITFTVISSKACTCTNETGSIILLFG